MNVFFAGGGSGGHLYPALAIARALVAAEPRVQPFFIGAQRGIERTVLPTAGFDFELLDLHPLYRAQPWLNWRTVASGARGWRRIAAIAATSRPCAMVATGGYASGVALGYASRQGIPVVIQEQNSFPGLTVRWFAPRATQIHLGFPEASRFLRPGARTRVYDSGNPIAPPPAVRPARADAKRVWGFEDPTRPTLLITGASQGAAGINAVIGDWVNAEQGRGWDTIWITGPTHYEKWSALESPRVRVVPYVNDMSLAYAAADLAVSRAGAMTAAELAAWGIVSIYVPLPTAAADHQTKNAAAIAAAGAGIMLAARDLNVASLERTVSALTSTPRLLESMRVRVLERARPGAAQDIAAHILTLACFK